MLHVPLQNTIHCSFQLGIIRRVLRLSSGSTSCSHGILSSSVSTSCSHAIVSSAITSSSPPEPPSESATAAAATIALFQSYGFSDEHIDSIFHKEPRLMGLSPERVQRKLQCFLSFGFSPAELITLVSIDPKLITYCASRLLYNLNFLAKMLGSEKLVKRAIARSSRLLKVDIEKHLIPNVDILKSHGVPPERIALAVLCYPTMMLNKSDPIRAVLNELKTLGMDPMSRAFIVALQAKLVVHKEKWDRKLVLYRSFGWSHENLLAAFKKHPHCMLTTEWKIKKMMGFYVNKLCWSPVFLSQQPIFIDLSFETRIAPRCAVLEVLASRGLLKNEVAALYRLLLMPESLFKTKFVSKYVASIPLVVEAYQTKEPGDDYSELKMWQERTKQKPILAGNLQF